MAAVPEDEESLLASGRESEDASLRFGKTATWQGRYRSFLQHRRKRVATFMTLAVLAIVFTMLWMLYV